jgi:hypothetical protein
MQRPTYVPLPLEASLLRWLLLAHFLKMHTEEILISVRCAARLMVENYRSSRVADIEFRSVKSVWKNVLTAISSPGLNTFSRLVMMTLIIDAAILVYYTHFILSALRGSGHRADFAWCDAEYFTFWFWWYCFSTLLIAPLPLSHTVPAPRHATTLQPFYVTSARQKYSYHTTSVCHICLIWWILSWL